MTTRYVLHHRRTDQRHRSRWHVAVEAAVEAAAAWLSAEVHRHSAGAGARGRCPRPARQTATLPNPKPPKVIYSQRPENIQTRWRTTGTTPTRHTQRRLPPGLQHPPMERVFRMVSRTTRERDVCLRLWQDHRPAAAAGSHHRLYAQRSRLVGHREPSSVSDRLPQYQDEQIRWRVWSGAGYQCGRASGTAKDVSGGKGASCGNQQPHGVCLMQPPGTHLMHVSTFARVNRHGQTNSDISHPDAMGGDRQFLPSRPVRRSPVRSFLLASTAQNSASFNFTIGKPHVTSQKQPETT